MGPDCENIKKTFKGKSWNHLTWLGIATMSTWFVLGLYPSQPQPEPCTPTQRAVNSSLKRSKEPNRCSISWAMSPSATPPP